MEGGCRGKGTGEKRMMSLLVSLVKITSEASSNTPVRGRMNARGLPAAHLCFGSVFFFHNVQRCHAHTLHGPDIQQTDIFVT